MYLKKGEQYCYKCKKARPLCEFYEKGNNLINCSDCRSQRESRKRAFQLLLQGEK